MFNSFKSAQIISKTFTSETGFHGSNCSGFAGGKETDPKLLKRHQQYGIRRTR